MAAFGIFNMTILQITLFLVILIGVVQESEAPGSYTSTQRAAIIRKKQESADGQRAKRPRPMLTQDIETMRAESMEEDVEIEEGEEEATRVESDVEIEEEEEEETAQSSGIKVLSYNIEQFGLTKYEKVWIRNTIFRVSIYIYMDEHKLYILITSNSS